MGGAYESDGFQDALYENPASWGTGWITLDLTGNETNKAAIGARVEVVVKENGRKDISMTGMECPAPVSVPTACVWK